MITSVCAGTIGLAWDASPSLDVNRYKVYGVQGTNTTFTTGNANATVVITVTNQLTLTVPGLPNGTAWTFAATAISTNNIESTNSTSVWAYIPYTTPSAPINLRITTIIP